MIFGRPINLWLGLVTASLAFAQVLIVTLVPATVATILGAFGGLLAVVIALVANQPAVVNEGDTVKVITPVDQPNRTITA